VPDCDNHLWQSPPRCQALRTLTGRVRRCPRDDRTVALNARQWFPHAANGHDPLQSHGHRGLHPHASSPKRPQCRLSECQDNTGQAMATTSCNSRGENGHRQFHQNECVQPQATTGPPVRPLAPDCERRRGNRHDVFNPVGGGNSALAESSILAIRRPQARTVPLTSTPDCGHCQRRLPTPEAASFIRIAGLAKTVVAPSESPGRCFEHKLWKLPSGNLCRRRPGLSLDDRA